jgi:hypothetical protein
MDRAIEDIEQGRVYKYDSLDDLIKEIEGINNTEFSLPIQGKCLPLQR